MPGPFRPIRDCDKAVHERARATPHFAILRGLRWRADAATSPAQSPIVDLHNGANVKRKILIIGLPGAGKTTLANPLAPPINAVLTVQ
jgi:predicted NACHT family NTPase